MKSTEKKELQESRLKAESNFMWRRLRERPGRTMDLVPLRKMVVVTVLIVIFAFSSGVGFAVDERRLDNSKGEWKSYRTQDEYKLEVSYPAHWSVIRKGEQLIIWGGKERFAEEFFPLEEIAFLPKEQRPKDYGAVKISLVSGIKESLEDYASYAIRYAKLHSDEGGPLSTEDTRWYFAASDVGQLACRYKVLEGSLFVCLDPTKCERAKVRTSAKSGFPRKVSASPSWTCKVAVVTAYRDPLSPRRQEIEGRIKGVLSSLRQY